jgi:hypothetical protein
MDEPGKYSDEIKDQLDRMLTHSMFKGARRSCSFLRYVTEKTLSGESYQIKEFSIAVDAFGLEPSFDQQIDPRIRVEAKRLRDRLKLYYEGPGMDDTIIISMEKGSYVPCFRLRGADEAAEDHRSSGRKQDAASLLLDGRFQLNISFENDAVAREFSSRVFHFQNAFLSHLFGNSGTGGGSLSDILKLQKKSMPLKLELHFHTLDEQILMGMRLSLDSAGVMLQCRQVGLDLKDEKNIESEAAREADDILEYCRSMKS